MKEWKLFLDCKQPKKNDLKLTTSSPKLFEKSSGEWDLLWGFELPWDIHNKNTKEINNDFTIEQLSQHTEAIFYLFNYFYLEQQIFN